MWPLPGRPTAGAGVPLARRGGGKRAKPKFGPSSARENRRVRGVVVQSDRDTGNPCSRHRKAVDVPSCRFCAGPLRAHVRRSRHVAAVRELRAGRPARRRWSRSTRSTRASASSCLLVQLEEFVTRRAHLQRVRLLLVVLRLVGRARARLRGDGRATASGSTRTASWSSSRATTATCCSTSSTAAFRCSASSPPRTSPRPPASAASTPIVEFFGRELGGARSPTTGRRRTCWSANNVLAQVPDLNDFVGGMEPLLAPGGVVTSSSRTCCGSSRTTSSTRSTTSTSRTSRSSRPARSSRRTASRSSTSTSCRRTAARCGSTRSGPASRRHPVSERVEALAERERALGFDTLEGYAAFAEQVMETKRQLLEFLIERRREGKRDRRLRRARQGQHAAQLLRHPDRPARLHGRPQPVQAGHVPAGHAHPDPPPGRARRRPGPTTS